MDFIDGENRGEFFSRHRFSNPDRVAQNGDDLVFFGDCKTRILSDFEGTHASHRGIKTGTSHIFGPFGDAEHILFKHSRFFFGSKVNVITLHRFDHLVIDLFVDEDGRFGSADHAVIEGFGKIDIVDGLVDIRGFVHVNRDVTGSNPKRGFAAAISGGDHGVTTGSKDCGNARMVHQSGCGIERRMFNPLDAVFRGSSGNGGIAHHDGRGFGAILRTRMEPKDNRVTGFDRD